MADIEDFDLDRSTAQAWSEFQARLAEIISMIDDTGDLTIGTESESDDPAPFVRFSSPVRDTVRAQAANNASLGPHFQLSDQQLKAMSARGWQSPDPDRGADFFVEGPQEQSDQIAELSVCALRDVYGVQHPVFLAPDQLAEILQPAPPPLNSRLAANSTPPGDASTARNSDERGLVLRNAVAGRPSRSDLDSTLPRSRAHLDELVDSELAMMYGHPPIRDEEGDVALRVGSTMLFLRASPDGQEVVIFAPVVHDVAGRSRATEVLNDLNVEARWVKFQLVRDRVFVTISVQARPFVPAHLHQAVHILSEVADGIDEELAAKLDGRTTFSEPGDAH
jgi:hypothetical protein